MRLIDYLSVPYRLEAATTELADGSWVRRVAYPELRSNLGSELTAEIQATCRRSSEVRVLAVGQVFDLLRAGQRPALPQPKRARTPTSVAISLLEQKRD